MGIDEIAVRVANVIVEGPKNREFWNENELKTLSESVLMLSVASCFHTKNNAEKETKNENVFDALKLIKKICENSTDCLKCPIHEWCTNESHNAPEGWNLPE